MQFILYTKSTRYFSILEIWKLCTFFSMFIIAQKLLLAKLRMSSFKEK